jgi:hypothetical protein
VEVKSLRVTRPPLTYREQALLIWLSTLYPPKLEIRDPESAAEFSQFSMVEVDDDGYPLQYRRAKTPMHADAGASPAGDAAPAEEIDPAEWMSTLQIAKRLTMLGANRRPNDDPV